MKKKMIVLMTVGLVTMSGAALARNTTLHLPLADVLALPDAQTKLDKTVSFYMHGTAHPAVQKNLGQGITNQRTRSTFRSDVHACQHAALDALLQLQKDAKAHGANAVVNLESNYKNRPFDSPLEYECHAGGVIADVALKGDYAMVAQ